MFGYIRPALDRLDQEQKDAYQSAYCGLCHALGRRHGWLARMTLQYDFTFLAIVLTSGGSEGEERLCRRCPVHPFRKTRACLSGERMDAAAADRLYDQERCPFACPDGFTRTGTLARLEDLFN